MTEWDQARDKQRVNITLAELNEKDWQDYQDRENELLAGQIERYEQYCKRKRGKK